MPFYDIIISLSNPTSADLYVAMKAHLKEKDFLMFCKESSGKSFVDSLVVAKRYVSDVVYNYTDIKNDQISAIELEYERQLNVVGVDTGLGFSMKSRDEDARILSDAIAYLISINIDMMNLKDVNGELHLDVTLAQVESIVNLIKNNYFVQWNNREMKKKQIRDAVTLEEILSVEY